MNPQMLPAPGSRSRAGCVTLVIAVIVVLVGARALASWVLDYQWWRELGHVDVWVSMMLYSVGPVVAVALLAFVAFWVAHARGLKAGGTRLRDHSVYSRLATAGFLLV